VTLLIVPINLAQGLPLVISAAALAFGLICFVLYVGARRGYYYPTVAWVSLMITLNVIWFPNAGINGSVTFFFLPAAMYAVAFYRNPVRWWTVGLVVLNACVLFWIDHHFPELSTPYRSAADRQVDIAGGFICTVVVVVLMVWVGIGVYERERERLASTAEQLAVSREQFSAIFQLNPEAVLLLDEQTERIIEVNGGFERFTGWVPDEVVGKTTDELDLWVDSAMRTRLYTRLNRESKVWGYQARLRARNGRAMWASISIARVEIAGRRCLLATARDVSTQIDAQRTVAKSRAMLATFLNSTEDLLWMVDPVTYGLTIWNDAFHRHLARDFGLSATEGLRPEDLRSPDLAARWRSFYQRALQQGPFAIEHDTIDGAQTLLLSFHVVRHDGEVLGVSVFGRDITALKRAQEEHDRIRLQFLQAQKMESLGSLAGGVAHDFNNMLASIMGFADLLIPAESEPERREHLFAIVRAATRSSELTRKLLAFARRGKNIVEAVDLNVTIRESLSMLTPSLRPDVTVSLQLATTRHVDGDPSQLHQMVVNLCINANEAMPQGGRLTVATMDVALDDATARRWEVPPGPYVRVAVADSGVGMTEAVRQRIFEPFFTTKAGGEVSGTGLGLSTVYGVVHLHRGTIRVESRPGAGTTFTVLLPQGTLSPVEQTLAPAPSRGSGCILVVEDEEMLRRLAKTALTRLGYSAITASDGVEAVEIFAARHHELSGVLLDLKMPRKAGRETFVEMRAIDPTVPVLLCSGYGENEEAQSLISMGAIGLLSKPYRIGELSELLARFRR